MERLEQQRLKVERLYQEYQNLLGEVMRFKLLFNEAKANLDRAAEGASLARNDYNQALAEYVQLQRTND